MTPGCQQKRVLKIIAGIHGREKSLDFILGAGNYECCCLAQTVLLRKKEEINFMDHIHIPSAGWEKKVPSHPPRLNFPWSDINLCYTFFFCRITAQKWLKGIFMMALSFNKLPHGEGLLPAYGLTSSLCHLYIPIARAGCSPWPEI